MKRWEKSCLKKNKVLCKYLLGFCFLAVCVVACVMVGSTRLSFRELADFFCYGADHSTGTRIIAYVRLPRVLAALACGGALSVSGAVIQGVLANRLASPGVIGVNAGAGLAVTVCCALGIYGGWQLPLYSFVGAFGAVLLVSLGAKRWGASRSTVLLMGVAMNSFLGAVSQTIVTFAPDVGPMSNDFKVGDFSAVTYSNLLPVLIITLAVIIVLLTLHNELDVLTLGEENAVGLGMNTSFVRTLLLLLAALLAGCAVSMAGLLSFVGLLVPHGVRRFVGNRSIHLIGLSALFGAGFVCVCDTMARTMFAPYEIPVGIIMAFLGAPFFVFILIKKKGGHGGD